MTERQPRQTVTKVVRTMQRLGYTITGVEMMPDNSFRVLTKADTERADRSDDIWSKFDASQARRSA